MAPSKLVCLESYWNEKLFQSFSVKGFFEAMAPLLDPPLTVAHRFLKTSGVKAVIGYTTTVDWMASLVCDMLFLHRFYGDPAPWRNLRRIFKSVVRDYPVARRLGYTLVTR